VAPIPLDVTAIVQPPLSTSNFLTAPLTTGPPEWRLMAWGGIGLGVIFGLPGAFFLLLLLRHVWIHRDSGGLKGLQAGRRELTVTLGMILSGGGGSGITSALVKTPETIICYVLAVAAIFSLTVSFVVLRVLIAIWNDFSIAGIQQGGAST